MNKQRRNELKNAIVYIENVKDIIKEVKRKEEFAYDSLPENLQYSNRGCDMEEKIDSMDEIIETIDDIISAINDVIF